MKAEIEAGTVTDKGIVEKIVYLTFGDNGWPASTYSDHPDPGGKGLVCAKIGNKNIPVGELKILNMNKAEIEKMAEEKMENILKKWGIEFDNKDCVIGSDPSIRAGEIFAAMEEYANTKAMETGARWDYKKKFDEFFEESKLAYNDLRPNIKLKDIDIVKIWDNAVYLFIEWLDENSKPEQTDKEENKTQKL